MGMKFRAPVPVRSMRVEFRMTPEEKDALEKIAYDSRRTISEVVRDAVKKLIENDK